MKTSVTILVNRHYSEVTPESVENGDTSDSGTVYLAEPFTFLELVTEIKRGGFSQEGSTDWLSSGSSVTCYRTMTEREETLHFSRENPEHLRKWFWVAARAATKSARNCQTATVCW